MNCAVLGSFSVRRSRIEGFRQGSCNDINCAVENGATNILWRRLVRKLLAVAILAVSVTACSKTADGDLEVEKPVVGTVTDTLNVPTVEIGTDTTAVVTPDIDIKKDTTRIKTPNIKIKR